MNIAAIIGYLTAILTVAGSAYGIWATRPKSKAETQFIYAQASDIVFDQLQEEVKRLHDGLIEERVKTIELEVQLRSTAIQLKNNASQIVCMSEKIDVLTEQVEKCAEEKGLLLRQIQEMGGTIRSQDQENLKKEE